MIDTLFALPWNRVMTDVRVGSTRRVRAHETVGREREGSDRNDPKRSPSCRLEFGPFELDPARWTLRREGVAVRIRNQPLTALLCLARRPGELVTREEFREEVWGDRIVEFDQGIYFCIRQIRKALGDDPKQPIYIETVPRRGYRFLAPVVQISSDPNRTPLVRRVPKLRVGLVAAAVASVGLWAAIHPSLQQTEREEQSVGASRQGALSAYHQGTIHLAQGWSRNELLSAVAEFRVALDQDPELVEAHAMAAISLSTLWSDFSEEGVAGSARSNLSEAFRLDPDCACTLTAAGYVALFLDDQLDTARDYFEAALLVLSTEASQLDGYDLAASQVQVGLGFVARRRGDFVDAVDFFAQASELVPQSFHSNFGLATTLESLDRLDEAIEAYRTVEAIVPGYGWARIRRIAAELRTTGSPDDAFSSLSGFADEVQNPFVLFWAPDWMVRSLAKRWEPRLDGVRLEPSGARETLLLASYYEGLGKVEEAKAAFRRALTLSREEGGARFAAGNVDQALMRIAAQSALGMVDELDVPLSRMRTRASGRHPDLVLEAEWAQAAALSAAGDDRRAIEVLRDLVSKRGAAIGNILALDPRWQSLRADPEFPALTASSLDRSD